MNNINIEEVTIDTLGISKDDIYVLTVMKVGTTNISTSLFKEHNPINHSHDLGNLQTFINLPKKKLIISGIRNPLDWSISFFFDTCCKPNEFPQTYVCELDELINKKTELLIESYFEKKEQFNFFNDWFKLYFDITKINELEFDKDTGLKLYQFNEDTYVLLYVLEKYEKNILLLENFLNIKMRNNINSVSNKDYKIIYNNFKNSMKMPMEYKKKLLDTDTMKYFYNEINIQKMYEKY